MCFVNVNITKPLSIRLGMRQSLTEVSANPTLASNNTLAWLIKAVTMDGPMGSHGEYLSSVVTMGDVFTRLEANSKISIWVPAATDIF